MMKKPWHRVWMIASLPIVIPMAIVVGPFLALEIVYDRFKYHWNN